MALTNPTLNDYSWVITFLDSGLVQSTFKFSQIRSLLQGLGLLTPQVAEALAIVESDPTLINIGLQTFKDAWNSYPHDTPISQIFGTGTGGTGGTGGTTTTFTPTATQLNAAYAALAGIAATAAKATAQFVTLPSGQQVTNELLANAQKIAGYVADFNAGRITSAVLLTDLAHAATDTTGLAVQASQFFSGKVPTQTALNLLLDNAANAKDLTDAYYLQFNDANRYIAYAADTSKLGSTFAADYGSLSFRDAVAKAYDAIIGNSTAAAAGVNTTAAIDYVASQQAYFRAYGGDDLGAKAAAAGFLMYAGFAAEIGKYFTASKAFIGSTVLGGAVYDHSLFAPAAGDHQAMVALAGVADQAPAADFA